VRSGHVDRIQSITGVQAVGVGHRKRMRHGVGGSAHLGRGDGADCRRQAFRADGIAVVRTDPDVVVDLDVAVLPEGGVLKSDADPPHRVAGFRRTGEAVGQCAEDSIVDLERGCLGDCVDRHEQLVPDIRAD